MRSHPTFFNYFILDKTESMLTAVKFVVLQHFINTHFSPQMWPCRPGESCILEAMTCDHTPCPKLPSCVGELRALSNFINVLIIL